MIRLSIYVVIAFIIGAFAFWLAAHPGQVSIEAFGLQIRTSAAAAIVFLLALTFLMAVFWRSLGWLFDLPGRVARLRTQGRRAKGYDALEQAVIAAASGDVTGAVKNAERVKALLDRPALSGLLAARAAESAGDLAAAERHYAMLLEDKRTALAARRGLVRSALERRDFNAAIIQASEALNADGTARWAFDALFDAQVAARDWAGAETTLARGAKAGHVVRLAAKRRKAVLLAAQAGQAEANGDVAEARKLAQNAVATAPGFAPGAALAARLLVAANKGWRAAGLLEEAWSAKPHPALALAYRDLKEDETQKARNKRLRGLVQLNPDHRESRILMAEIYLSEDAPDDARAALAPVLEAESPPSSRLCLLMQRIEHAAGNDEAARDWLSRSLSAPGEADWSDLDPEGPAFGYRDEDWARLVYSYGDAGELIHPRHERFEQIHMEPGQMVLLQAPPQKEEPQELVIEDEERDEEAEEDETPAPVKPKAKTKKPARKKRAPKKPTKTKPAETDENADDVLVIKTPNPPSPDLDVAGFPPQPDDPGPLDDNMDDEDAASVQTRKRKVH